MAEWQLKAEWMWSRELVLISGDTLVIHLYNGPNAHWSLIMALNLAWPCIIHHQLYINTPQTLCIAKMTCFKTTKPPDYANDPCYELG